jgi:hypothetical protein
MATDVTVQLGMFGVSNRIAGTHVVQAHTRVTPDGEEVFVGEHLRWNRGRTRRATTSRASASGTDVHDLGAQQDLFGPTS